MKRYDIQALRAIAVLSVIGYHASPERLSNGYFGVDIFFVISGFLVTPKILSSLNRDARSEYQTNSNLKNFYKRRFFRLAPSLFSCLLFGMILVLMFVAPRDFEKSFGQMAFSLIGLGNIGAWWFSGDYFSPHPSPFLHTWSLAVEEQIYILLPILFLLSRKVFQSFNSHKIKQIIIVLSCMSFACGLTLQNMYPNQDLISQFVFYSPLTRFYEFGIGAILSTSKLRPRKSNRYIVTFLVLLGIGLIFPFSNGAILFFSILGLTSLIIIVGQVTETPKLLKPLVAIGNMSYSLYLFHLPLLFIAFYSPMWPDIKGREPLKLIAVLLLFPISYLNYKYFEGAWIQKGNGASKKSLQHCALKWIGIPFFVCSVLFVGSGYSFFGLDPNTKPLADPALSLGECYSLQGESPCALTKNNSNEMALLIGDSHARHLSLTFESGATRTKLAPSVWTQSGCQFILPDTFNKKDWRSLVDKYGIQHKGETQSCFEHNLQIIEWLKLHNATVVLTFRSTSMIENDLGADPSKYRKLVVKNIRILAKYSKLLVVIGPNPEYLDHSRFFGGGTLIWQKSYETTASTSELKREMSNNPFLDNEYYAQELANSDNIKFINGIEPFCSKKSCVRQMHQQWLYTDVDHLSLYGTQLYANRIVELIKP